MTNSTNSSDNGTDCVPGSDQNIFMSVGYMLHGSVYTVLYIPCLIVICRKPLIKESCYKIMAAMGFMDLGALAANCYGTGIVTLIGDPWCVKKSFWMNRAVASAGMFVWMSYALTCVFLAVNRLVAMFRPHSAKKLFTTTTVVGFVSGSVAVGLILSLLNYQADAGLTYAPKIGLFVFEPNPHPFVSQFNELFNYVIGISLVVIYILIVYKLNKKASVASSDENTAHISRMERSVTIQSVIMCSLTASAAWGYMILPKFNAPLWSWTLINVIWQMAHGMNAVIYLTLNKTIIRGVKRMFGAKVPNTTRVTQSKVRGTHKGTAPATHSHR